MNAISKLMSVAALVGVLATAVAPAAAQTPTPKRGGTAVMVLGTDPLSLMSLAGFSSLKSLAEDKCSPYSTNGLGISIGEGAGVLVMS